MKNFRMVDELQTNANTLVNEEKDLRRKIIINLTILLDDNDGHIYFDSEDGELFEGENVPSLFYGDNQVVGDNGLTNLYGMSLAKGKGCYDTILFNVGGGVLGDSGIDTSTLLSILLATIAYLRNNEVKGE